MGLGGWFIQLRMVKGISSFCAASIEYQPPDLLGWGASDHPDRAYSTEDYLQGDLGIH